MVLYRRFVSEDTERILAEVVPGRGLPSLQPRGEGPAAGQQCADELRATPESSVRLELTTL